MLYLLRHGQTNWNIEPARCQGWIDVPLNEAGRAQARLQARQFADHEISRILTSHLRRARETAEIIADELATADTRIDVTPDERLAETRRGQWEGRTFAEIMRREPGAWRTYREHPEMFRFPGGESLAEQQARVLAALRDAARGTGNALLVTHGGCIRLARAMLEHRGIQSFHQIAVPNGDVLTIPCARLAPRIEAFLKIRETER